MQFKWFVKPLKSEQVEEQKSYKNEQQKGVLPEEFEHTCFQFVIFFLFLDCRADFFIVYSRFWTFLLCENQQTSLAKVGWLV